MGMHEALVAAHAWLGMIIPWLCGIVFVLGLLAFVVSVFFQKTLAEAVREARLNKKLERQKSQEMRDIVCIASGPVHVPRDQVRLIRRQ